MRYINRLFTLLTYLRRAREEVTRRRIGSVKQGIITYYRVLNPKRLKKPGYYYHQMHTFHNTAPELQPSPSRKKLNVKSTMIMRRRYINFLLTYFHNKSKKAHITKYSIKSTINSSEAKIKLSFQNTAPSARKF